MGAAEGGLGVTAGELAAPTQIDEHQVVVGAAGHDGVAPRLDGSRHVPGVVDGRPLVGGEGGLHRLLERHRLRRDDVHEGSALHAGEHARGEPLLDLGVGAGEDEPSSRPAQGLVGGGGGHVRVRHRARVEAGRDEARDVCHVGDEVRFRRVRDGAKPRPVDHSRVRGEPGDDDPGPVLACEGLHLVVVDLPRLGVESVLHRPEDLAGEVDRRTVGEVPALGEAHAEDGVPGLGESEVGGGVRLGARVGLDVGVVRREELLRTLHGQRLRDVDELAPAVVAAPRVALRVLVGEYRPLSLQYPRARVVLRRDELEVQLLTVCLGSHRGRELVVESRDPLVRIEGRMPIVRGDAERRVGARRGFGHGASPARGERGRQDRLRPPDRARLSVARILAHR